MFWFGFAFGVQLPRALFTGLRLHVSYLEITTPASVKGHCATPQIGPLPRPEARTASTEYGIAWLPGIT